MSTEEYLLGAAIIIAYIVAAIFSANYLNKNGPLFKDRFDRIRRIVLGILFGWFLIPLTIYVILARLIVRFIRWVFKK